MFKWLIVLLKLIREAIIISLIQNFEADFLWKVSLKNRNSGLILKTFTHGLWPLYHTCGPANSSYKDGFIKFIHT